VLAWTALIVQVPVPTMVIVLPTIVAIPKLELTYVNSPGLLEVGATIENDASPATFVGIEKPVIVGMALFTVSVAVIVADS
jgi:hypothetical protein